MSQSWKKEGFEKMNKRRVIAIIVATIFGLAIGAILFFSPGFQNSINDPADEEHFEILKETAMNVAKTLDKNIIDEGLTASYYITEKKIVVNVKSESAKVEAKIPIKNQSIKLENGTITSQGIVDYENVEYTTEKVIMPVVWYIILTIFVVVIVWKIMYSILTAEEK